MGQFKEAIETLKSILDEKSLAAEPGILISLANAYLDLGVQEAFTGFSYRAESSFLSSIETALKAIESSPGFRRVAWKFLADSLYHLSDIDTFADISRVCHTLSVVERYISVSDRLVELNILPLLPDQCSTGIKVLDFAVAAFDYRITFGFYDEKAKASAWFDLGIALQSWAKRNDASEHRKGAQEKSTRCLKESILADAGNELYWVALGDTYFEENAKSAQHAYVKALEINSKARYILFQLM